MEYLQIRVRHQSIERMDTRQVVADSHQYLGVKFDFRTADWDRAIKTAIFTQGNSSYNVLLENDACVVPWEVLEGNKFTISVVGNDNGSRITTDIVTITVIASGYENGETPSNPSASIYEQILAKLEALSSGGVSDVDVEAIARLVKAQIDIPTDADITNVVRAYVESHKDELKGNPGEKGADGINGADGRDGADGVNGRDGRDGQDYVITASDYDAIADVVLTKISSAEGVTF